MLVFGWCIEPPTRGGRPRKATIDDSMMPPWQATTMVRPASRVAIRCSVVAARTWNSAKLSPPGDSGS
jgi:hypothetical protein